MDWSSLPAAFIEDRPRYGDQGYYYYQVFNEDGVEVAAGRGESLTQANEIAKRLLWLLCFKEDPPAPPPATIPF